MADLWNDIVKGLAELLNFLYRNAGHDYGVAIILLTLGIRVLLLPLTIKQTRSMHEMQRVQPMLKKLQEKHKNDKQKMQEEMMKFYQEHKINPLGGCLPMVLQLPVLFALFRMLTYHPPLIIRGVEYNFLFLVPDLSKAASNFTVGAWATAMPYYVLVVLMIVTTYVPQKMMTKDPQQEKIMIIMSLFMAWIGWGLPAGVMLYWVTTNIWTIVQQYIMLRGQPQAALKGAGDG